MAALGVLDGDIVELDDDPARVARGRLRGDLGQTLVDFNTLGECDTPFELASDGQ